MNSTDAKAAAASRILPVDYFRLRDFEYVQPLYDLAFLLEINALVQKQSVPKYRTFSFWRAGYSLDGYDTKIDRWLDGTIQDEDLDYVPSGRIREYLNLVRKKGTFPELRDYRSERYARCLRLRSIRGLGPKLIAQSVHLQTLSDEWLRAATISSKFQQERIVDLFHGQHGGPWQSAHVVPPLLRFLNTIETILGKASLWNVSGILTPFEPITVSVIAKANVPKALLEDAIGKALRKERLFRRTTSADSSSTEIKHRMGWSFSISSVRKKLELRSISQISKKLDPFAAEGSANLVSDLHLHTAWSDGSASVNTMAAAVAASGLKFFAVTDHSRSCKLQGGLTPVLWLRQANALTLAAPVCPVLHGIEVDIRKDGTLDLPQALLAAADLVVASVHSSWTASIRENTNRLLKAVESGSIDIIAHPTSAVIGKPGVPDYLRAPAEVDWEAVFAACARWRVALEMNCFPSRLDLPLSLLKRAIKAGCAISFGSDAHARSHLQNLRFGKAALRRLKAGVVLNRLSFDELKQWIQESRVHRELLTKTTTVYQQSELQFELDVKAAGPKLKARIQPPQKIPTGSRVVGIDLTAGDKATGLAVLNGFSVETCSLTTDEEILEYVRKQKPGIVSIDSPLGLPGGGKTIDPKAGIMRVAEHDLASIGIPAYPSLIDSMKNLTLRGIRLRKAIESFPKPPRVIESYPGAAQDILCIPRKQKSMDLLREGLRRLGLDGPGLDTRSHDEMDAITSAIVGRYYESKLFEPMGIPSEAQLIVPKVGPLAFEQNPVICLAGKTGAGKSVVARYLSVFYGFAWVRTRNLIRELLIDDATAEPSKRLWSKKIDPTAIAETDLREFGAVILNEYKQEPLHKQLLKTVKRCSSPVVVDSIRDIADAGRTGLGKRPVILWFIECTDSIIRKRLAETKKLGKRRAKLGSPVDRTASEIRREAHQIISNSGSLEELRWALDDALFGALELER